jgi:class 3 adenylate cyclase
MAEEGRPDAHLVVLAGSGAAREVAIYERMFVGRECTGIEARHRLLVDDDHASRNHLEIRVRRERGASVVDTSTNGTRLNGVRIERAVPVPLKSGDRLTVGSVELEFRTDWSHPADAPVPTETIRRVSDADLVMVVGDIVGFSAISAGSPSRVVMETLDTLLRAFRSLLTTYQGTLSNFVGDAFFAVWEAGSVPQAPQLALDFVVAAAARLDELTPTLALRSPDGGPLRIGWGVARGDAAVSSMTGALLGVVGDAANLAFRLSGLAAREGRGEVLVAAMLYDDIAGRYPLDARAWIAVKGRREQEPVHALRLPIERTDGATS